MGQLHEKSEKKRAETQIEEREKGSLTDEGKRLRIQKETESRPSGKIPG